MPGFRFATTVLLAALVGGLTGAVIAIAVTGDVEERERGSVVRVSGELNFDVGPWCSTHHRFCIPEFDDPEEARAFYMVHTHPNARGRGCPVEWLPDQEIASYVDDPETEPGAFRGLCIGHVWLADGTSVFGPAPRDLDEFRVEVFTETVELNDEPTEVSYLEVDTRTLICGDYSVGATDRGCELAPPFD